MSNRAPGELRKVQLFVNTWDEEPHIELLDSPQTLDAFFKEHGLWSDGRASGPKDLAWAIEIRESIRALLRHNHGEPLDQKAVARMNEASAEAGLSIEFDGDAAHLGARAGGATGAIGNLLAIIANAMSDGTWSRLKICQNDDCAVSFYDAARNRSGKWCSMEICGNRMKARNFRARHA